MSADFLASLCFAINRVTSDKYNMSLCLNEITPAKIRSLGEKHDQKYCNIRGKT